MHLSGFPKSFGTFTLTFKNQATDAEYDMQSKIIEATTSTCTDDLADVQEFLRDLTRVPGGAYVSRSHRRDMKLNAPNMEEISDQQDELRAVRHNGQDIAMSEATQSASPPGTHSSALPNVGLQVARGTANVGKRIQDFTDANTTCFKRPKIIRTYSKKATCTSQEPRYERIPLQPSLSSAAQAPRSTDLAKTKEKDVNERKLRRIRSNSSLGTISSTLKKQRRPRRAPIAQLSLVHIKGEDSIGLNTAVRLSPCTVPCHRS